VTDAFIFSTRTVTGTGSVLTAMKFITLLTYAPSIRPRIDTISRSSRFSRSSPLISSTSRYLLLARPGAFGRGILALRPLRARRLSIQLDQHGLFDICGQRIADGLEFSPMPVCDQLDAARQTVGRVEHDVPRGVG